MKQTKGSTYYGKTSEESRLFGKYISEEGGKQFYTPIHDITPIHTVNKGPMVLENR